MIRNQLIDMNYDPESLTKQSDTDLHNMQEQTFAGIIMIIDIINSTRTSIRRYQ